MSRHDLNNFFEEALPKQLSQEEQNRMDELNDLTFGDDQGDGNFTLSSPISLHLPRLHPSENIWTNDPMTIHSTPQSSTFNHPISSNVTSYHSIPLFSPPSAPISFFFQSFNNGRYPPRHSDVFSYDREEQRRRKDRQFSTPNADYPFEPFSDISQSHSTSQYRIHNQQDRFQKPPYMPSPFPPHPAFSHPSQPSYPPFPSPAPLSHPGFPPPPSTAPTPPPHQLHPPPHPHPLPPATSPFPHKRLAPLTKKHRQLVQKKKLQQPWPWRKIDNQEHQKNPLFRTHENLMTSFELDNIMKLLLNLVIQNTSLQRADGRFTFRIPPAAATSGDASLAADSLEDQSSEYNKNNISSTRFGKAAYSSVRSQRSLIDIQASQDPISLASLSPVMAPQANASLSSSASLPASPEQMQQRVQGKIHHLLTKTTQLSLLGQEYYSPNTTTQIQREDLIDVLKKSNIDIRSIYRLVNSVTEYLYDLLLDAEELNRRLQHALGHRDVETCNSRNRRVVDLIMLLLPREMSYLSSLSSLSSPSYSSGESRQILTTKEFTLVELYLACKMNRVDVARPLSYEYYWDVCNGTSTGTSIYMMHRLLDDVKGRQLLCKIWEHMESLQYHDVVVKVGRGERGEVGERIERGGYVSYLPYFLRDNDPSLMQTYIILALCSHSRSFAECFLAYGAEKEGKERREEGAVSLYQNIWGEILNMNLLSHIERNAYDKFTRTPICYKDDPALVHQHSSLHPLASSSPTPLHLTGNRIRDILTNDFFQEYSYKKNAPPSLRKHQFNLVYDRHSLGKSFMDTINRDTADSSSSSLGQAMHRYIEAVVHNIEKIERQISLPSFHFLHPHHRQLESDIIRSQLVYSVPFFMLNIIIPDNVALDKSRYEYLIKLQTPISPLSPISPTSPIAPNDHQRRRVLIEAAKKFSLYLLSDHSIAYINYLIYHLPNRYDIYHLLDKNHIGLDNNISQYDPLLRLCEIAGYTVLYMLLEIPSICSVESIESLIVMPKEMNNDILFSSVLIFLQTLINKINLDENKSVLLNSLILSFTDVLLWKPYHQIPKYFDETLLHTLFDALKCFLAYNHIFIPI